MLGDTSQNSCDFDLSNLEIAVLIPCYNEEAAVPKVIADFRAALPQSTIFVYDNNSTDNTVKVALEAGAIVRHETIQGKGNVIRRMFADIEADIYLIVDGDDTYHAASAPKMVRELLNIDYFHQMVQPCIGHALLMPR